MTNQEGILHGELSSEHGNIIARWNTIEELTAEFIELSTSSPTRIRQDRTRTGIGTLRLSNTVSQPSDIIILLGT